MDNKYFVILELIKKVEYDDIEKTAVDYYNYKINNFGNNPLFDLCSYNDKIYVLVEEKDGKYYLDDSDIEIFLDNNFSINYGYVNHCKIPSNSLVEKKSSSKDEINNFLVEAAIRRKNFDTLMNRYIFNILTRKTYLIDYMKKTSEKYKTVFKWVYVYDSESNNYHRFVLPLIKNNITDERFSKLVYDYNDAMFGYGINSKGKSDNMLYTDNKHVIPNENNFELLHALYILNSKKEYIRSTLKDAFDNKKSKIRDDFYGGEKKNGNNFSK